MIPAPDPQWATVYGYARPGSYGGTVYTVEVTGPCGARIGHRIVLADHADTWTLHRALNQAVRRLDEALH